MGLVLSKLASMRVLERVFRERLSEPVHLNLLSLPVALFGSLRAKIYFDLLVRQHHAYGLLAAADQAKLFGHGRVTAIEFGVANGAGLLNMCKIAARVTRVTGIAFDILGFDNGSGMPQPADYRDHPEYYQPGWFPMQSHDRLRDALPANASLVIGDVAATVPAALSAMTQGSPLGFVSVDVDYHSSTVESLRIFEGDPELYLPTVIVYLDDVQFPGHNEWAGEMLAVREFSDRNAMRKIGKANFLREQRLFKRASWISHMYHLHVFDHPSRSTVLKGRAQAVLTNPHRPGKARGAA